MMPKPFKILKGKSAKKRLIQMLDDFDKVISKNKKTVIAFKYAPLCKGLFKDKTVYVAFDNSTGECWCEEFKSKNAAKRYLKEAK